MENDKKGSLIIFFLFLLLFINFFWINKEFKIFSNNIFLLNQTFYAIFIIISFTLIFIFLKRIIKKRNGIKKILSNNECLIIQDEKEIIAIKGLEVQEIKENNQENSNEKFQTFISTLVKNKVPCIYMLSIMPLGGIKNILNNEEIGSRIWLITFGMDKEKNKSIEKVEKNFLIIESALQTAFPKIYKEKIKNEELRNFFEIFFLKERILKIKKDKIYDFFPFSSPFSFTRILPILNNHQKEVYERNHNEKIYLGLSLENGLEKNKEYLPINNINKHIVIFGSTGTGKTTTALSIVLRLWEKKYPILILDWHNEYGKIAEKIDGKILNLGGYNSYSINPFKPLFLEDDIYTHIDMLCDIFSETFNFSAPQSHMFLKALLEEYKARGLLNKEVKNIEVPNLLSILERIQKIAPYSRFDYEIKMALERRLQPLTLGQLGEIFCGEKIVKIEDMMKGFTVIELGNIKSYLSKRILLYLILKIIYDYCIHRDKMDKLVHVTVIEEAQNIVPMKKNFEIPSIGERLIFDVRKFGEGIILIAQIPSQISENITKNVSTRVFHAIKGESNMPYYRKRNKFYEEEKIVQSLREGETLIDSIGRKNIKIVYIEPHEMLKIN